MRRSDSIKSARPDVSRQFICFALVGAVGTIFHYAILIIMAQALELPPIIGSASGFVAGALVNYSLNYRVTFHSTRSHRTALPRFYLVALLGFGVNGLMMYFMNDLMSIHYLIAQVIATWVVLLSNFTLNKLWTFKELRSCHQQSLRPLRDKPLMTDF